MDDIVLVTTFYDYSEATVVQSLLRDHGIECELFNSNMAQLYPGNSAFTIQLMARRADLERIEQVLSNEATPK